MRHPEARWLTGVVLFHDPTTNFHFQAKGRAVSAPGTPGYPVPAAKSLFSGRGERGLPIGNLTGQFWANVYLNEVDQFVKRRLRMWHYLRYVDDLVLLDTDRGRLVAARHAVGEFLRERLGLMLRRDPREPEPVARGLEFVGWRTSWSHRLPRRHTLGSLVTRLDGGLAGVGAHLGSVRVARRAGRAPAGRAVRAGEPVRVRVSARSGPSTTRW